MENKMFLKFLRTSPQDLKNWQLDNSMTDQNACAFLETDVETYTKWLNKEQKIPASVTIKMKELEMPW